MNTIETNYVHNTYQIIAEHFNNSRAYLWKSVKEFLVIQALEVIQIIARIIRKP